MSGRGIGQIIGFGLDTYCNYFFNQSTHFVHISGAIIDAQQKSGYTPIHDSIASADGKKETTEWFVINGANMVK